MENYLNIASRIIKEQELIIGPLAWDEAKKVKGLQIDADNQAISFIDQNQKNVIDSLVNQYKILFGEASREVCKSAVKDILLTLSDTDVPSSLK